MLLPSSLYSTEMLRLGPEAEVFLVASDITQMHRSGTATPTGRRRERCGCNKRDDFRAHPTVFANAVQAPAGEDSGTADASLQFLEPSNGVWTLNLASDYARAVRDVSNADEPAACGVSQGGFYIARCGTSHSPLLILPWQQS